jgi:hypothetical protein
MYDTMDTETTKMMTIVFVVAVDVGEDGVMMLRMLVECTPYRKHERIPIT